MVLSHDLRKALVWGALITAFSVTASFVPVWIWLQIDPVIDLASIYISTIALPLMIAPTCSYFILRARMRAERLARENYRLATRDELTGLPNRRAFFTAASALQARAAAGEGIFVCAIADIDNFKLVNDEFGHEAGDSVLKSVGGALAANAPEGGIVARLGGEEFAVAALFAGDPAARASLGALVDAVRALESVHEDMRLCVTISLGHAAAEEGDTISGLLSRADQALYRAKGQGKDCAVSAADLPPEARWEAPRRAMARA
ncbi:MAG: GGDEF domain-containing protein [Hyphomonas sp.]